MFRSIFTFGLSVFSVTTFVFIISQPPQKETQPNVQLKNTEVIPHSIVINPKTLTFNVEGKLTASIVADKLEYFKNKLDETSSSDFSFISEPKLSFHDKDQAWLLTAKHGVLQSKATSAVFSGNVVIQQTLPADENTRLETESVNVFIEEKYAETSESVKITSPYGIITATGMSVDFVKQQIKLTTGVKGTHEPI